MLLVSGRPPTSVAILPASGPGSDCPQRSRLVELAGHSSSRLIENPSEADLVFVTSVNSGTWHSHLWSSSWIHKNARRCFAISESDEPKPLLHGIYTSATKSLPFRSRLRTAAYGLAPAHWHHPLPPPRPAAERKYLFSFIGRDSSPVRKEILTKLASHPHAWIEDTSRSFDMFNPDFPSRAEALTRYAEILSLSSFVLCPRGNGAASLRLFEAMKAGIAPVILSDDWLLPHGPDWCACSIRFPERELERLPAYLCARAGEAMRIGKAAREAFAWYFAPEVYFDYLVTQADSIRVGQRVPERLVFGAAFPVALSWCLRREGVRSAVRLCRLAVR